MIEFKERGKGAKWHHRTPRARINRLGGDNVAYKEANWFKGNWDDDRHKWAFKGIKRFLMVNIGRPVDKVFSEFLKRCGKSTESYNLKKIFYDQIEKKDEITWYGGFYVTNGILNYKKRISMPKRVYTGKYIDPAEYNGKVEYNLKELCELADTTHKKQFVGNLYTSHLGIRPIYLIRREDYFELGNRDRINYRSCYVYGIGDAVRRHEYSRQTKPNIITYQGYVIWVNSTVSTDENAHYLLITKKA